MARFDVTTIGEGQLRMSVPEGHRLEQCRDLTVSVSGTEANVTSLLARLGWQCGWLSSLPNNPLGRRVYNEYRLSGLDLSAVTWSNQHRLATYYVEYAAPPRATQVYFDRANSCFTNLTSEQIDWDYLLDTRLLHLTGITLSLCPALRDILFEAAERAKAKGIMVSFDMNYRQRLWSPEEAAQTVRALLQHVDLFFCSRGDAKQLFAMEGNPQEIVTQLADLTPAKYIITSLSSDGLIGWDGETFYQQTARAVKLIDRIGAGDGMVGGVLHGWLQGDFAKALRYGALTAALSLSVYGDQVVTTAEEVERLLDNQSLDIVR